jgi:threonine/homoserine/homoserine lactone efflux protein
LDFQILISFVLATAVLAFSPGPDNIFVLVQSATHGKKTGMAVVLGLMTGCLIHTSLVAFGLSAFVQSNKSLYFILKLFGAAYMLNLAIRVYKSDLNFNKDHKKFKSDGFYELFKQGFTMNVLNPKVSVFFLAFFPAFLFSETMSLYKQFYILGFLFILTSFSVFSCYVFLSSYFSKLFLKSPQRQLLLKRLQIGFFIGIAVVILRG